MDQRELKIRQWLQARRREWIKSCQALAAIQFLGAAFIFSLYVIVLAAFLTVAPGLVLGIRLGIWYFVAGGFLLLLCWLHCQLYASDSDFTSFDMDNALKMLAVVLNLFIFSIPILFRSGSKNLRKIKKFRAMDTKDTSRVLSLIFQCERQVQLTGIKKELSDIDLDLLMPDLLEIQGVLHLKREPEGLALSENLRGQLEKITHKA